MQSRLLKKTAAAVTVKTFLEEVKKCCIKDISDSDLSYTFLEDPIDGQTYDICSESDILKDYLGNKIVSKAKFYSDLIPKIAKKLDSKKIVEDAQHRISTTKNKYKLTRKMSAITSLSDLSEYVQSDHKCIMRLKDVLTERHRTMSAEKNKHNDAEIKSFKDLLNLKDAKVGDTFTTVPNLQIDGGNRDYPWIYINGEFIKGQANSWHGDMISKYVKEKLEPDNNDIDTDSEVFFTRSVSDISTSNQETNIPLICGCARGNVVLIEACENANPGDVLPLFPGKKIYMYHLEKNEINCLQAKRLYKLIRLA